MNLLYVHTHDSGRYFQPYGYAVETPHIQKLAMKSVLFRNAYCCAPTCSPSRASMLTGQCAHSSGMLGLAHRGFSLSNPQRHLSYYLRSQGYDTVLAGIQHETINTDPQGYDRILTSAMNKNRIQWDHGNAQAVCDFLKEEHKKPFYVSFGMFNTHRAYPKHDEKIDPRYIRPAWPLADTPENREDMADYMTSVSCVDDCVGIVLEALQETHLNEDTLVLFTTDHGIAMPLMKCNLYDTGIGVAMMMLYPGNKASGEIREQLVSHVDVFPTICDILNVPKPDWLQGVSLLPVIENNQEVREEIFSEVTYHAAYEPKRCVRTKKYKLIRHYDYHNGVVPANIDASAGKDYLLANGYMDTVIPREELYDLALDPVERINLVNEPRYKSVYDDLSKRLYLWMSATDDPLLRHTHRVPMPDGAQINKLTCIDPQIEDWEIPEELL